MREADGWESPSSRAAREKLPERATRTKTPAWVHEPMHRATDDLIASGAAERALKAGDRAPEFTLKDANGR
jgi:hypothetical protein